MFCGRSCHPGPCCIPAGAQELEGRERGVQVRLRPFVYQAAARWALSEAAEPVLRQRLVVPHAELRRDLDALAEAAERAAGWAILPIIDALEQLVTGHCLRELARDLMQPGPCRLDLRGAVR